MYLNDNNLNEMGKSPTMHLGVKINGGSRRRLTNIPPKAITPAINTYKPINTITKTAIPFFPITGLYFVPFLPPTTGNQVKSDSHSSVLSKVHLLAALPTQRQPSNSSSFLSLFWSPVACHPLEATLGQLTHRLVNCKSPP